MSYYVTTKICWGVHKGFLTTNKYAYLPFVVLRDRKGAGMHTIGITAFYI